VGALSATFLGIASLIVATFAVFAFFQWQERRRVHRVRKWVSHFLVVRYGVLPNRLSINCFEDFLSPVIVRFDHPISGIQHRMQFSCPGSVASFDLLSERVEPR